MANQRYIVRPGTNGFAVFDQTRHEIKLWKNDPDDAQEVCDRMNGRPIKRGPDNGNHGMEVYRDWN